TTAESRGTVQIRQVRAPAEDLPAQAAGERASVLVLGGPSVNPAAGWVDQVCGDRVTLHETGFVVENQAYEGREYALLVSCRPADSPERVVTVFFGVTPEAATRVARLLFFYGWQSYLVFRDGAVLARGDFDPVQRPWEARFHGQ
ncbi:MAG: hypothetical protein ACREI3_10740, partial [Nitrospirales bacterium]